MKKNIAMPALKPDMKEGILCRWNVEAGDSVSAGDVIYEVETDKVVAEIEADSSGTISDIFVEEGDAVEPGTVLAQIETDDIV